ncbi:hypothetical protein CH368_16785, partial [Leptospira levettii]
MIFIHSKLLLLADDLAFETNANCSMDFDSYIKKALTFVNALSYVMSANRGNVLLPPPLASPLRGRVSEPCSLWVASLSFREQSFLFTIGLTQW